MFDDNNLKQAEKKIENSILTSANKSDSHLSHDSEEDVKSKVVTINNKITMKIGNRNEKVSDKLFYNSFNITDCS